MIKKYHKKINFILITLLNILVFRLYPQQEFISNMLHSPSHQPLTQNDIHTILTSDKILVYLGKNYKNLLTQLHQKNDVNTSIIPLDDLHKALADQQFLVQTIIPISATIVQDQTGLSTTCHLYKCQDTHVTPSASYADFTITFNDSNQPQISTVESLEACQINDLLKNSDSSHLRSLKDAWIKLNPHNNVDMRMTGSITLLGQITLPGAVKNINPGSPIIINAAGQLGTGSVSGIPTFTSDVFIAQNSSLWASKINPRSPTTTTSFNGNIFVMNGKDLEVTGSVRLRNLKNKTSSSSSFIVIDPTNGQLATNTIQNPTYTFSSDFFIAQGSSLKTNKIDPRSPTTTTSFSSSISLPTSTTANNGSLQINGSRFLHNFGTNNTFIGTNAGNMKMSGTGNTAIGSGSLIANTTGNSNIGVGINAGNALTSGSNNISIGNTGVAAESNTIRIGTTGTQSSCFIAGISGNTLIGNAVNVASTGELGVILSSRKYKDDIKDMGTVSDDLMKLRPVTFKYKKPPYNTNPECGLIAEEVAQIYPNLVCYKDNQPESVRYDVLPSMLLNEYQKLRKQYEQMNERLKILEQKN